MAPSVGETNLTALLATMQPVLQPDTYVFLTFPPSVQPPAMLPTTLTFAESEGTTVITTRATAEAHGLTDVHFPSRMITLQVHSSLEAVGFLATITAVLCRRKGMATNVVSAFFHDHIFVPEAKAEEAMEVLRGLVEDAQVKIAVEKMQ
ncbi:hypothetical protein SCP_0701330 [Sparassis crispa]|uniref:DUF2241 domain-containing protein n=1 Tax=Sparassis crispa TaxID=139825 RepID=A0A401GRS9_9APHY|nr:hypothetical protein SCP_0701330 [Sparassis crispa]GBE84951.1 hypothetical protein SCP_0701330 [Sparassis crispa]